MTDEPGVDGARGADGTRGVDVPSTSHATWPPMRWSEPQVRQMKELNHG